MAKSTFIILLIINKLYKLNLMKKQKTLVSILIINYNNAKVISRSILSCLNQSYKETEILVFDDQSSENSRIILNKYL